MWWVDLLNMNHPQFSIITPCYNAEDWLQGCYQCLLTQSIADWEWLVIDDGSTDNSSQLLNDLSYSDDRVKPLFISRNSGAGVARNVGLETAQGQYLAFLDVDDVWLPEKLAAQLVLMEEGVMLSFTAYRICDHRGLVKGTVDENTPNRVGRHDLLMKRVTMGCSTVMVRKELIGQRRFPTMRRGQDYLFWLNLLEIAGEAVKVNKVMTEYRIRPGSISRNKFRKAAGQWSMYRGPLHISLWVSAFYFFHYAKNAVFRK